MIGFRQMNGKVLFSVGVKVIGLLSIGRGGYDLIYVIAFSIGQGDFSVNAKFPGFDLLLGIIYTCVGLYLLRGGARVVDFAFPDNDSETGARPPEKESTQTDN